MSLGADASAGEAEPLPVRMLNEYVYCPRLFYLEFVQGEFADNEFTVEGRNAHRRIDAKAGPLPEADEPLPFQARSVALSSSELGISARIDVVEGDGESVIPIDYKRGKTPDNPERSYEPERVQLCAYGLLLREQGYTCDAGVLYYVGSKERVDVPFEAALVERTLSAVREARAFAEGAPIPPPLRANHKCAGCSLHGICLPDEVNHLLVASAGEEGEAEKVRQLLPARDDASPLVVQEQGARIGLDGDVLEIRHKDRGLLAQARLFETSQVVVFGNVQVSAQALRELCDRGIPVVWLSFGGWFYGMTDGLGHKNVELRLAQYRAAGDAARALALSRRFVRTKVANCRTLLRRNHAEAPENALREMAAIVGAAGSASTAGELLGLEGNGARLYFDAFSGMLRPPGNGASGLGFEFKSRNRRPPKDPVNALLSFAYALLVKDLWITARAVGFDPLLGFYHRPRYGRPALALDLMEEFRPLIADSVVLSSINTGVVTESDFVKSSVGVALKPEGRKRFLKAYERRMDEEITHPVFGYRISYRRVLEVQCRLLARHLMGELPEYPEFRTR